MGGCVPDFLVGPPRSAGAPMMKPGLHRSAEHPSTVEARKLEHDQLPTPNKKQVAPAINHPTSMLTERGPLIVSDSHAGVRPNQGSQTGEQFREGTRIII